MIFELIRYLVIGAWWKYPTWVGQEDHLKFSLCNIYAELSLRRHFEPYEMICVWVFVVSI